MAQTQNPEMQERIQKLVRHEVQSESEIVQYLVDKFTENRAEFDLLQKQRAELETALTEIQKNIVQHIGVNDQLLRSIEDWLAKEKPATQPPPKKKGEG